MNSPRRILIIKPSSLGDIIQGLRVAQAIRDQRPDAEISWVVRDKFADVVKRCSAVNGEVILFDRTNVLRGGLDILKRLRQRHYDVVMDLQGLLRSGLMTWAANAPLKLGHRLCREGSRYFYDRLVPFPTSGFTNHNLAVMLQFLPEIGLQAELTSPIHLDCQPPYHVDERLRNTRPVVLLPNSREPAREWAPFAELAEGILKNNPAATVVWDSHIPFDPPPGLQCDRFVNLSSRTTLMDMMGLLQTASLVVANDSGGLHVAAAMGIPLLGLYGPTFPGDSGPYPPGVGTNRILEAPDRDLSKLSVDTVLDQVLSIISSQTDRRQSAA